MTKLNRCRPNLADLQAGAGFGRNLAGFNRPHVAEFDQQKRLLPLSGRLRPSSDRARPRARLADWASSTHCGRLAIAAAAQPPTTSLVLLVRRCAPAGWCSFVGPGPGPVLVGTIWLRCAQIAPLTAQVHILAPSPDPPPRALMSRILRPTLHPNMRSAMRFARALSQAPLAGAHRLNSPLVLSSPHLSPSRRRCRGRAPQKSGKTP